MYKINDMSRLPEYGFQRIGTNKQGLETWVLVMSECDIVRQELIVNPEFSAGNVDRLPNIMEQRVIVAIDTHKTNDEEGRYYDLDMTVHSDVLGEMIMDGVAEPAYKMVRKAVA